MKNLALFLLLVGTSALNASMPQSAAIRHVEVSAELKAGLMEWRMELSGEASLQVVEDLQVKIAGRPVVIPQKTFKGLYGIAPLTTDIRSVCGLAARLGPDLACVSIDFLGEHDRWAIWVFQDDQFAFWAHKGFNEDESKLELQSVCYDPEFDEVCVSLQEISQEKFGCVPLSVDFGLA